VSRRYLGGFITANPTIPTASSASGAWTTSQQLQYASTWPFGGPFNYIEDVFSTWLYTGTNPTNLSINNGIDLSGKGGMVWIKGRNSSSASVAAVIDTVRGASKTIKTFNTNAEATSSAGFDLVSFNNNGFTVGASEQVVLNSTSINYASWTFREQPKFFDVVTYTGDGTTDRNVAHNLGSQPGMVIVKAISDSSDWNVRHIGAGTRGFKLNTTAAGENIFRPYNTDFTSTTFYVTSTNVTYDSFNTNRNGVQYVAYLFAHNAGGFGLTGNDNVISCGSFTVDGSGSATVNLGYEPQWIIAKGLSSGKNWWIFDVMRGMSYSTTLGLQPNTSNSELDFGTGIIIPTATGFRTVAYDSSGETWIYTAIRRPMKVPTTGTSVFSPVKETTTTSPQTLTTGFPVDLCINTLTTGVARVVMDRLRGGSTTFYNYLDTSVTSAEATGTGVGIGFDNNTGVVDNNWWVSTSAIFWNFRRASGFFDVVCYTGNSTAGATQTHNLGVVPELIIVKKRTGSTATGWAVYSSALGATKRLELNTTAAPITDSGDWNDTAPTSTVFTLGFNQGVNNSASTYVAYLFATCAGVSKVGSYTGTGSTQTISCGFTGGARFVLIKRTDSTGSWWVWDTARGMVSGTDPRLALNSTAAETNNDWVYTTTGGFQIVTSDATINANGGSYIFLAIA
jgi:hypothetical protein